MHLLFHVRWLLVLLLGFGNLSLGFATHLRGGNITHTPVAPTTAGVPRYHVMVQLFLDARGPSQDIITLTATNGNCGVSGNSFAVEIRKSQSLTSIVQSCTSVIYNVGIYETDLDLPPGQWTLSVFGENRAANIVNMTSSVNTTFYIYTFLDNTLVTQNSSPRFESLLNPYLNTSAVSPHSFSAFDVDGDSLRYELVLPRQTYPATPSACSAATLSSTVPPQFTIDAATGALQPTATASQQGYYAIAAIVSEYRRVAGQWRLLGYVARDLTYLAVNTTNQPPTFTSLAVNGAVQPLGPAIAARPGQAVSVVLTASDPDAGQQLRFSTYATSVVPGLTLTTLSATQVQLTWQVPATLPAGRYAIPVAVLDDGCPYNASEDRTLVFSISNRVLANRPTLNEEHEVYPVPFHDQVQFKTAPNQAVTLVDALGRTVARLRSADDGRVVWQPAASLPAGLYLARSATGQPLARLLRAAE